MESGHGALRASGGAPRTQGGRGPGEFVGGMAHVHAGIVQHQVADIDQVAVEDERPHRLGHVAARLPTGGKTGGLEAGIEPEDADRDRLQSSGDGLPRQLRQIVGARDQPLVVELPSPARESVTGADWGATIPSEEYP